MKHNENNNHDPKHIENLSEQHIEGQNILGGGHGPASVGDIIQENGINQIGFTGELNMPGNPIAGFSDIVHDGGDLPLGTMDTNGPAVNNTDAPSFGNI